MNNKPCIWEDKVLLFETKNKIMYNSSCVTNQELNNICQETDIADQRTNLFSKKLQFLDFCKQK